MRKFDKVKDQFAVPLKVMKGASLYSIGDVLIKASGFFLIPIYTRILTPTDYGIIGYLQVFSHILVVILGFGFHGAQTRYYFEHKDNLPLVGKFMFSINVTTVIAFIVVCIPLIFIGYFGNWDIGNSGIPFHPFMTITLVSVLITVLNNYVVSSFQMKQKFLSVMLLNTLSFLLSTCFTIVLVVFFKKGAFGRVSGNFYGILIILLPSYFLYAKKFTYKYSLSALKYALAFGFPVVIHLLMGSIHSYIDRIMLESYLPLSDLGIYSLGVSIASVLQMFITAFNQAFQPNYYELMEKKDRSTDKPITQIFTIWLSLITFATCMGIIIGRPFLKVFAGSQFGTTSEVFPYLLYATYIGSFYYFFSSPIFYFKKTGLLPFITGSSAIINISLNLLLIPNHGIIGASIATIISHLWISVVSFTVGHRLYKMKWPYLYIFMSVFVVSIVFVMYI